MQGNGDDDDTNEPAFVHGLDTNEDLPHGLGFGFHNLSYYQIWLQTVRFGGASIDTLKSLGGFLLSFKGVFKEVLRGFLGGFKGFLREF